MPLLEKELKMARRSLRGWTNLRPPVAHAPMSWSLACLVAIELNRMGKTIMVATHDLALIRAAKTHVQARVLRISNRRLQLAGADL